MILYKKIFIRIVIFQDSLNQSFPEVPQVSNAAFTAQQKSLAFAQAFTKDCTDYLLVVVLRRTCQHHLEIYEPMHRLYQHRDSLGNR